LGNGLLILALVQADSTAGSNVDILRTGMVSLQDQTLHE
jgi:hypothetical protein